MADAIFNCGWHERNIKNVRAYILFIMMRAQNTTALSAGGMIAINRATITFVSTLSFIFHL